MQGIASFSPETRKLFVFSVGLLVCALWHIEGPPSVNEVNLLSHRLSHRALLRERPFSCFSTRQLPAPRPTLSEKSWVRDRRRPVASRHSSTDRTLQVLSQSQLAGWDFSSLLIKNKLK